MRKKHIHSKDNWKPVQLTGAIFNSGFDDLIGIEECTDYDLTGEDSKSPKRKSENEAESLVLNKKRKNSKSKNIVSTQSKTLPINDNTLTPSKDGHTAAHEILCKQVDDVPEDEVSAMEGWSSFGLPIELLKGLKDQGFVQPTHIQALTLPPAILGRKDILGAAETGSGKTLAFGLPILTSILKIKEDLSKTLHTNEKYSESIDHNLDEGDETKNEGIIVKPLYALIITPTRELAIQIKNHLVAAAKYTDINVAVIIGGLAAVKQERILNKGPEIVIGTPGRLWELIQSGYAHLAQVNNIKFLVIDETDRMLERGHFQELQSILEKINMDQEQKKVRQNFVFSATLTLVHDLPKYLKNKKFGRRNKSSDMDPKQKLQKIVDMLGITDPKIIDVTEGFGISETLTECRINCDIEEKDYYVYYFLQKHPGRTLIFCNSIGCVKRLTTLLTLLECNPLPLHASMQQRQRLKNLERFRDNTNSILIATDVAARGLDIPCIEHVLHYQTPRTSEGYIHRSGRTARARKQGITVLLIDASELRNYIKLCRTLNKSEDIPVFPVQQNYLNAVKQRIHLARELDKLQLLVRKTNSETGWFDKAAKEMDLIVDHMSKRYDTDDARKCKKLADLKRKQMASLLTKPIFPRGFSGKYPLISADLPQLNINQEVEENAIDAMNNEIEKNKKIKKKTVPLYKPKNHNQKTREPVMKLDKPKSKSKKTFNNRKQKNSF